MSFELKAFTSPEATRQYLAQETNQAKTLLAEYLFEFRKLQGKATREVKTKDTIMKIFGRKGLQSSGAGHSAKLGGVDVVVNPNLEQEQNFLQEVIDALQRKIDALNKVAQFLSPVLAMKEAELALTIQMITNYGVPMRVMLKTTDLYADSLEKKITVLESSPKMQTSEKAGSATS